MQMPEISRGRALAYVLAVLLVLVIGGRYLLDGGNGPTPAPQMDGASVDDSETAAVELTAEETTARSVVVHVVGAVARPGLYELPEGSRVDDAIEKAGGPTEDAALANVNLAAPVGDGQQIVIAANGEVGPPTMHVGSETGASGLVRLNSATLAELETLPGIGPVTAQKILDYREQRGGFTSIDELDAVPGIGPARLEQLREHVQL